MKLIIHLKRAAAFFLIFLVFPSFLDSAPIRLDETQEENLKQLPPDLQASVREKMLQIKYVFY